MNKDILIYLINHVVFPIKLPEECSDKDDENEIIFLKIIKNVIENLHDQNKILKNSAEFNKITDMIIQWTSLQGYSAKLDKHKYFDSINALKNNQSLTIYVRSQNSCLTVKPISNDEGTCFLLHPVFEKQQE
jgi:hypothetical protein